jgi:predicted PurR-regulated permease PerM
MTITRPTIFWIAISSLLVLVLLLLRPILMPFAIGLTLAYLLVPAVERLERVGCNRSLAASILVLSLVLIIAGGTLVMLPAIVGEIRFLIAEFPHYVARMQSLVMDTSRPWLHNMISEELHSNEPLIKVATTMGGAWFDDTVSSLWSSGESLISLLGLLVVVPIVSIYFLTDWNRMIATADAWLPANRREVARNLRSEIRDAVGGFVRGQIVICLILAVFYAAALKVVGLNHAIPIGVAAGLISFVPYLGAATGFVIAMCVAIAQFWPDWIPLAIVGSIFLVGENVADYVLAPRIIGRRVKLNPVWLMFSLFAFGYLFGFIGLLIAIPLAASLGVIVRFATRELLDGPEQERTPIAASAIATPATVSLAPIRRGPSAESLSPGE